MMECPTDTCELLADLDLDQIRKELSAIKWALSEHEALHKGNDWAAIHLARGYLSNCLFLLNRMDGVKPTDEKKLLGVT